MICNECETVAHCLKNGCVPKQPSHEALMKGYKVACDFGIYESNAFKLAEKMYAAMLETAQLAPVQQSRSDVEPVAWSVSWHGVHCGNFFFRESDAIEHHKRLSLKFPNEKREVVALYTTPPNVATPLAAQRQWVGLTTEDMATCIDEPAWDLVLRKAEQILKEKNT